MVHRPCAAPILLERHVAYNASRRPMLSLHYMIYITYILFALGHFIS